MCAAPGHCKNKRNERKRKLKIMNGIMWDLKGKGSNCRTTVHGHCKFYNHYNQY